MLLKNLKNKKIAIWGQGIEGQAIKSLLDKHNISSDFIDDTGNFEQYDVVFKSPGVSLYKARQKPISILTSATNLYMANKPSHVKTIAVTGTKGKSTTSSLIYHILKKKGYKVGLAGNIGKPLIDFWGEDLDFLVCEMSSYQCADLSVGFDRTIILNLYPEHIDWHLSHENYYTDKLNILSPRQKGQIAILNIRNKELFNRCHQMDDVVYFNQNKTFIPSPLSGEHNQENLDAIKVLFQTLNIDISDISDLISDFKPLPHRLEKIAEVNNIICIDDSISTTPQTTLAALKTFKNENIVLIAGGFEREQDYGILNHYLRNQNNIIVIGMPDTGNRIWKSNMVSNMGQAVELAFEKIKDKGIILLSPGAPSYNLYPNFISRGEDFKKNVLEFIKKRY